MGNPQSEHVVNVLNCVPSCINLDDRHTVASPSTLSSVDCLLPTRFDAAHSVSVLYDNVVQSHGTDIQSSCFSTDEAVLYLTHMHSVNVPETLSYNEKQYFILRHLLLGNCMSF